MSAFFPLSFSIRKWQCVWLDEQGQLIGSSALSLLNSIPKLLQRRLSPLAKAVFSAGSACLSDNRSLPLIFSTAHGETNKSFDILQDILRGEEVSPAAFSLSVHNAFAGLFSMAYQIRQEITVLAPGLDGMASGFLEAVGLLQEGHSEVLLVFYDEPLSGFFPTKPFLLNPAHPIALAMCLTMTSPGDGLLLQQSQQTDVIGEHAVQIKAFADFLANDRTSLALGTEGHFWQWQKI